MEMVRNAPGVAWKYEDDIGVLIAHAPTHKSAILMIEEMVADFVDDDEVERCEAMDGLGYNSLHGLYVNLSEGALCADFPSCGMYVVPSGDDGNGRLVNEDTRGDAVVVGDTLYCSRFCADHR